MTITLYGRKTSANVQKVLWALEELGLDYEQVDAGGKYGKLDEPDFVTRNPNKLIPVIDDDGLILWESHAIMRYLAAQYGRETLWREDPRDRAPVDQWTDWAQTTFQPAWIGVFWPLIRTPPAQRDQPLVAANVAKTEAALTTLGAQIEKAGDFVCGAFSYADIATGVALHRWYTMEIEREVHPAIEGWFARLKSRDAFTKSVCTSYEELRAR